MQAGGRRFESDRLHQWWRWIRRLYRREANVIGIVGAGCNKSRLRYRLRPLGGVVVCQGKSGSGAPLGVAVAKSDRVSLDAPATA